MNADLMIDYVLGRLEGPDRDRMEEALRNDPEISARADRLGQAVSLLLDDGNSHEPPPGLARPDALACRHVSNSACEPLRFRSRQGPVSMGGPGCGRQHFHRRPAHA